MDPDARRGRTLVEESREAVIVLDDADVVLLASRRARQSIEGIDEGERVPDGLLSGDLGIVPLIVPYEVGGRRERIVYLSQVGDMTAYEELRTGFTAAVSHELRTPLARLLSLLETATLPGEDIHELVERARNEVESASELIDEVLFLSELESGGRVVSLGPVPVRPELDAAVAELEERASRAGVTLSVEGDEDIELEMRPRMLRVIAQNLAENAIRYAGPGASFTLAVERDGSRVVLRGTDDGVGVDEEELSRLFERFYRADHARASRGTGLGLAIVKHIVGQAGGIVEASGGKGAGLEIRCVFWRDRASVHRFFTTRSPPVIPPEIERGATLALEMVGTRRPLASTTAGSATLQVADRHPTGAESVVFDVRDLSVSYSGKLALKGVDLEVRKNFVTAFIGPSGCGKSTFIRCFNRMNDLIPGALVEGSVMLPRDGSLRIGRRPRRGSAAHRHGLPEAEPVPEVDLRQHRLRAHGPRDEGRTRRADRAGAALGGPLGRGQGSAQGQRARSLGRTAAATLHRSRDRRRARGDPDGRAGLGARPDLDRRESRTSFTSSRTSTRSSSSRTTCSRPRASQT